MIPSCEKAIEEDLKAKGLTAPRITPEMVQNEIRIEEYHIFPGTMLTVCALTLKNGFVVTGESACASPENFDAEIGRKIAFENARQKIWSLLGFRLRDRLYADAQERAAMEEVADLLGFRLRDQIMGNNPSTVITDGLD